MPPPSGVQKGAYILADAPDGKKPEVILMATGSEVSVCVDVYEKLKGEGIAARVVSMPSWDIFERQDEAYQDSVLPPDVDARVAVEQAGDARLGPLCRPARRAGGDAYVRRVRAACRSEEEVRLHARACL